MAQSDNFGFTEEAALLKESARKLFAERFSADTLHRLVAADPTPERRGEVHWDQGLWQQVVDLGWTLLAVPEAQGGVEMPLVAVAGLVEELGRAALPCPLLPTLACTYVLQACGADDALAEIAAGETASLVITGGDGSWAPGDTPIEASGDTLGGTAHYVQEAAKVSRFLVCAHTGDGLSLYWVAADAPGITVHGDAIVDLTRDQARVSFEAVAAVPLAGDAQAALARAFPAIWTLYAADMVGAGEWQLQATVDYVNQRQQFERPLGFFQAVKHPLVNVMIAIDQAKSLVYAAACAFDEEPDRATQLAHMAQSAASDMAEFASSRSVQCHGGIGFTWECYVHLFFKRQRHSQMLWGDGPWHREQLATLLIDNAA